ncbi:MAG: hypothetical protein JNK40_12030 [Chromatiales bacterium]|nr:hypothetical protein [Chromatiales bacterium]
MDADSHTLLRFVHILLFVYWLGADFGVFLGGGWMSRPGLTVVERNRIRDLVMAIDVAPRISLVLMLPVGFSLALAWGAPLPATVLPVLWAGAAAWIAVLLWVHFAHGNPLIGTVLQLDLGLRVLLLAGMLTLGFKGLTAADSIVPGWLSMKFLLFAAIIADGIVLRRISGQWYPAIARLQSGDTATGEAMLRVRRRKAIVAALTMWLLIAAAGFLGTLKP